MNLSSRETQPLKLCYLRTQVTRQICQRPLLLDLGKLRTSRVCVCVCVCAAATYPIAELRLWCQSLRSSWLQDISRSLALGKVSWRKRRKRRDGTAKHDGSSHAFSGLFKGLITRGGATWSSDEITHVCILPSIVSCYEI